MAFDLFTINGAGGSAKVIRGYAPNTSKVGTSLFRPIVSLIAFTAIYRYTSSLISLSLSSARIILYTRRSGLWYLSTLLILLWASTSTSLILINSCFLYSRSCKVRNKLGGLKRYSFVDYVQDWLPFKVYNINDYTVVKLYVVP
jgi:hypothetical protein